jgi:glycosyltransferase involved in cell wall biosynthesis
VLPFQPQARVRDLFRRSDVHVYLTVPFVLFWSVLEAMATGCALVASDTPPVREVVGDGRNGLLADMRDPEAIAAAVERLLDDRATVRRLRAAARATVEQRYALKPQLARQEKLVGRLLTSLQS